MVSSDLAVDDVEDFHALGWCLEEKSLQRVKSPLETRVVRVRDEDLSAPTRVVESDV